MLVWLDSTRRCKQSLVSNASVTAELKCVSVFQTVSCHSLYLKVNVILYSLYLFTVGSQNLCFKENLYVFFSPEVLAMPVG